MYARVRGQSRQASAQDLKEPGLDSQPIKKNQIENDPADREQTIRGTECSGSRRRPQRHAINAERDSQSDRQPEQGREVNPNPQEGDRSQQDHHGQRSEDCGKSWIVQRIVPLEPNVHGLAHGSAQPIEIAFVSSRHFYHDKFGRVIRVLRHHEPFQRGQPGRGGL